MGVLIQLVLWNHVFVSITAETLFKVLTETGFVPDGRVIKLFDRLRGGNCDLQPALNIGALRLTALSAAPPGSVETTALLTFEVTRIAMARVMDALSLGATIQNGMERMRTELVSVLLPRHRRANSKSA